MTQNIFDKLSFRLAKRCRARPMRWQRWQLRPSFAGWWRQPLPALRPRSRAMCTHAHSCCRFGRCVHALCVGSNCMHHVLHASLQVVGGCFEMICIAGRFAGMITAQPHSPLAPAWPSSEQHQLASTCSYHAVCCCSSLLQAVHGRIDIMNELAGYDPGLHAHSSPVGAQVFELVTATPAGASACRSCRWAACRRACAPIGRLRSGQRRMQRASLPAACAHTSQCTQFELGVSSCSACAVLRCHALWNVKQRRSKRVP